MERPFSEVLETYLRASAAAPHRAEALHAASHLCRENNKFADGFEYARRGLSIPPPADGLFVDLSVYDYRLLTNSRSMPTGTGDIKSASTRASAGKRWLITLTV